MPPKVIKVRTHLCKDPERENPGKENQKISQKKNMTEKLKDMESSPRSAYIHLMSTAERKNRPTGNPKRISRAEEKQELQIERVFPVTSPKRRKPLTYNEKRNKIAPLFTWQCHPFNGNTRATREGGNMVIGNMVIFSLWWR